MSAIVQLSQEDRDDLARSINKTEAWFVEKYAEQSAAPAHEAPVITSDMIRSRIEMVPDSLRYSLLAYLCSVSSACASNC